MFDAFLDWSLDHPIQFVVVLLLLIAIPLAALGIVDHRAQVNCKLSNGTWVKTGTSTTYVLVGNVLVPVTTDEYGCHK